jgi:hypothetical protein
MWKPNEVGNVLAQRKLAFRSKQRRGTVTVKIGQPVRGDDPRDPWWCPIEIDGAFKGFETIAGEDSLQALVLGLRFLQLTLPSAARRHGGEVDWLGERERLIFADTEMLTMLQVGMANLVDGVAAAAAHIEKQPKPPKALLSRLRQLVASGGMSGPRKRLKLLHERG